jgi:hypothetical protein
VDRAVYVEFWTYASRHPELRRKVAERQERLLDSVGELVEEFARRWGVEFTIPAGEVVRGTYALSRGMGLERLLDPKATPLAPFAALPEVIQYQIRHDRAGLDVRGVLRASASADTPARVRAALARELQAAGTVPPAIQVTPVPEIRREGGHGAKVKLIQTTA